MSTTSKFIFFLGRYRWISRIFKSGAGFTLIELLVVIAIIGVLAGGLLSIINPLEQIKKARDAQRKQDIAQIQKPLEVYYNDHGVYPTPDGVHGLPFGNSWGQYMSKVPQDPTNSQSYVYQTENGGYRLYAKLERCSDSQVIPGTCDTSSPADYNYSITSSNLAVAAPGVTSTIGSPPGGGGGSATATPTPTPTVPVSTNTPTPTPTFTPSSSTITLIVYNDVNNNGIQDTGETNYAGGNAAFTVSNGTSTLTGPTTIGVSGTATLSIASGTYRITLTPPSGYQVSNGTTDPVDKTLPPTTTVYFGIVSIPTPTTSTTAPSSTPTPLPYKRVFVTSTIYTGNLGGIGGAHGQCQVRANAAGLGGAWKAWISQSTNPNYSPTYSFSHATIPYKLVDGTLVANNWSDLTDGALNHPINMTEFGGSAPTTPGACTSKGVWTNTYINGDRAFGTSQYSCEDWTYAGVYSVAPGGYMGNSDSVGTSWTGSCSNNATGCSDSASGALYCFEQ